MALKIKFGLFFLLFSKYSAVSYERMLIPLLTKISHVSKTLSHFLIPLLNHHGALSHNISLDFAVNPSTRLSR